MASFLQTVKGFKCDAFIEKWPYLREKELVKFSLLASERSERDTLRSVQIRIADIPYFLE